TGAYSLLREAALSPTAPAGGRGGRDGVEPYDALGYVPASRNGSVSLTTEYGQDDFALAGLAEALGESADAERLRARSLGYRKLFDPGTGFLRARNADGSLAGTGFEPLSWRDEYVEANAWQSLFAPAYDEEGLAGLFGGREIAVEKLSEFFDQGKAEWDGLKEDDFLARSLPRDHYWHGNEPDIHAAYLFAQLGRPDLTQRWVRWILTTFYSAGPEGLAGNDDGGTLSSWYVFSALGLYPLPGSDRYLLGAPLFPRARLAVGGGDFTIEALEVSEANLYVQSVELNGRPLAVPELLQADLKKGGKLLFRMGPKPSGWGRR
ncbi:MAG: glycoside hydrolase domain-containing protein, partial [Myxococcaceae bacterium]